MQRNEPIRIEKNKKTVTTFFKVEHRHNNPAAHFECVLINKSIIYVTKRKQKAPINMFHSKAPKTQQIAVTGTREKPVDFYKGIARASALAHAII